MPPVTVADALKALRLSPVEFDLADRRQRQLSRNVWPSVEQGRTFDSSPQAGGRKWWNFVKTKADAPCYTIPVFPIIFHPTEPRVFAIPELRRLCSFPEDWQDGAPA